MNAHMIQSPLVIAVKLGPACFWTISQCRENGFGVWDAKAGQCRSRAINFKRIPRRLRGTVGNFGRLNDALGDFSNHLNEQHVLVVSSGGDVP